MTLVIVVGNVSLAANFNQKLGFTDTKTCPPGVIPYPQSLKLAPKVDSTSSLPVEASADQIEIIKGQKIMLQGEAQIVQGSRGIFANQIQYQQNSNQVEASGNLIYYSPNGDEIRADNMNAEIDTFIGEANNARIKIADSNPEYIKRTHSLFDEDYTLLAPFRNQVSISESTTKSDSKNQSTLVQARAKAAKIMFESEDILTLYESEFTTCPEGNNDILLKAKKLELDLIAGIGIAKSVSVRFKNKPILYLPRVSFPINDQRKTGFLLPSIGGDKESGIIIEVPYYINIAPQVDATLTPRYMSKRGIQLYSELRYLGTNFNGSLRGEYLPSDRVFAADRYAIGFNHLHRLSRNWNATVDLKNVSDRSYKRDFASNVQVISSSYLPQQATLRFNNKFIQFALGAKAYELINENINTSLKPYEKLPEVKFNIKPYQLGFFELGLDSSIVQFTHDNRDYITGVRSRVKPWVKLPIKNMYSFFTPKLSLQSISYSLDNSLANSAASPSAVIPIVSVDSGLFFERDLKSKSNAFTQTLEPRAFVLYIPKELDQQNFPIFDTGLGSTNSFSYFFRENRFFGGDRVGDTKQISLGLTSRLIEDTSGIERVKASIGQVFYLEDRVLGLSPDSPRMTEPVSATIADAKVALNLDWSVGMFAKWDYKEDDLSALRLSTSYNHSVRRKASISYWRTKNSPGQIITDFSLPISSKLQFYSSMRYSIKDKDLRSISSGIIYDGCCWAFKLGGKKFLDGKGRDRQNLLMIIELDHLGRLGRSF